MSYFIDGNEKFYLGETVLRKVTVIEARHLIGHLVAQGSTQILEKWKIIRIIDNDDIWSVTIEKENGIKLAHSAEISIIKNPIDKSSRFVKITNPNDILKEIL